MVVFIITSAAALFMTWTARQFVQPKWEHLAHRFPAQLLHRWSLGSIGLSALYLFFVMPFVLLGEYVVAAVAFFVTSAIILISARDVLEWIIDDIREHRAEKRPLFRHGTDCVVHSYYGHTNKRASHTPESPHHEHH